MFDITSSNNQTIFQAQYTRQIQVANLIVQMASVEKTKPVQLNGVGKNWELLGCPAAT